MKQVIKGLPCLDVWSNATKQWCFNRSFESVKDAEASARLWERDGYKTRVYTPTHAVGFRDFVNHRGE